MNAFAPGLVDTELHAANGEPGRLERVSPSIPIGRAGTPEEIARGVLWLLSDAASYVTGTILEIGGRAVSGLPQAMVSVRGSQRTVRP